MSLKSIKFFILGALILVVSACGKTADQEVKDAVLSANILLSTSQCQPAIDLLESIGRQPRNAYYLKTLSSAYACRAGYSTVVFFGSDISKTASPAPLGGLTTYSTSLSAVTSPLSNDSNFRDLQTAIDILLYAGGIPTTTEPFATERAKFFSANQAGDINTELAFMLLVQVGKMMKVYGNASALGVKGAGGAANNCFTDYSDTPAEIQTYVTTILPGACSSVASSHSELAKTAVPTAAEIAIRRARLCQGVVLMNSILDILPSVLASAGGTTLGDISSVTTKLTAQKTKLTTEYPAIGSTATVVSQTNCETDTAISVDTLASYYAVIFEGLIE